MDILSIDFDIIMAPVIEYYNHMVPSRRWEDIQEENPFMITPKADLLHFNYLLCFLNKAINNDTKFYIAYNHKMILNFLKEDEKLTVVNIDHHHDLGYHPDGILDEPSCANWARILFEQNKMEKYVWAKNVNSQLPLDPTEKALASYNYTIIDFNELKDKIYDVKFDKIFLCLSPEWVPPYYQELFFGILDLLN